MQIRCEIALSADSLSHRSPLPLSWEIAKDTFNAEIETMYQSYNWSADTRLFYGTAGGVTEAWAASPFKTFLFETNMAQSLESSLIKQAEFKGFHCFEGLE